MVCYGKWDVNSGGGAPLKLVMYLLFKLHAIPVLCEGIGGGVEFDGVGDGI